jgi:predicted TIM-barrel fold metal-dependent hydrolase
MSIVDADTHLIHDKPNIPSIDLDGIVRRMDACGVDRAIVWPSSNYDRAMAPDNAVVAEGARRHRDRLIGFGRLNPRLGLEDNLAEVDRCRNTLGLRGFKFIPHLDDYPIDSERLVFPIIERAASLGAVIGIHCDVHHPTLCHPWQVGRVAEAFPGVSILMVHIGKPAGVNSAVDIALRHKNITVIGSDIAEPFLIRRAVDRLGADRVCFGSDTPFFSMRVALTVYAEALDGLTKEQTAQVMGENLLRVTR